MTTRQALLTAILGLICSCAGSTGTTRSATDGAAPPSADGGVASSSNLSCTDIFACFYACQQNDAACEQGCINTGTAQAQQRYSAIEQCEAAAGCACSQQDSACLSCLEQACGQSYQTCGLVLTCSQIYQCDGGCAENDNACYDRCVARGRLTESLKYYEMFQCFDTAEQGSCKTQCVNPSDSACYTCVDQACAAKIQACGVTF